MEDTTQKQRIIKSKMLVVRVAPQIAARLDELAVANARTQAEEVREALLAHIHRYNDTAHTAPRTATKRD